MGGVAGGVGGEREDGEDEGNGGDDDAEERDAAWSFVSFPLEKDVEEALASSSSLEDR